MFNLHSSGNSSIIYVFNWSIIDLQFMLISGEQHRDWFLRNVSDPGLETKQEKEEIIWNNWRNKIYELKTTY